MSQGVHDWVILPMLVAHSPLGDIRWSHVLFEIRQRRLSLR